MNHKVRNGLLLLGWCWIYPCFLAAQNLLQNSSFEQHAPLQCESCHLRPDEFSYAMRPWQCMNSHAFICNCNYEKKPHEEKSGICFFNNQPYDGCTMIEMDYSAACISHELGTRGCGSLLGQKLTEPLEIGKTYEVSFWLYIARPYDPGYEHHIGMNLYPDMFRHRANSMENGSDFLIDTVLHNVWYEVKWPVRPICRLQYLLIGVFRDNNGPPTPVKYENRGHRNVYYIDKAQIRKTEQGAAAKADAVPFCSYKNGEGQSSLPNVEGAVCYFGVGHHSIQESDKPTLDEFAQRAKKYPGTAFIISGHTDDTGNDHISLSKARVEGVLDYLETAHQLSRLRFVPLYSGDKKPAATGKTANDRQQNRRVEITQVDYPAENVVYRNILSTLFENQKALPFKELNIWLNLSPGKDKLFAFFDPRLNVLKNEKAWGQISQKIKNSYRTFSNPGLAWVLDSLWAEDQKSRTLKYYIENLNSYIHETDSLDVRWNVHFPISPQKTAGHDGNNFKKFVEAIGSQQWPRMSEVGERAAKAAFLIVSHSMDTTALNHYLPIVKNRCAEGEAAWLYYATMHDRLLTLQGKPQRFGTQYKTLPGDKPELFPMEDQSKTNEWRAEIGLPPLDIP